MIRNGSGYKNKYKANDSWYCACAGFKLYQLIIYSRGGDKVFYHLCMRRNSIAETFRRSNDCSNFNDSVNHSAHKELLKNPVFFFSWSALNQLVQPRNTFVYMLSAWLWWAGSLTDWGALWEKHFSPLFSPLALDNVPVTQWLDAMWELRGGLLLLVVGSLCGVELVCMCATEPWLPHY